MLDYRLLDFGAGRRLERFGPLCIDRLCPAAQRDRKENPSLWSRADVRFEADASSRSSALGERGHWVLLTDKGRELFFESNPDQAGNLTPKIWPIQNADPDFTLNLAGSPFGHLGVFPEQAANWTRIFRSVQKCRKVLTDSRPVRYLNLFAYTGGSTLAAAAGGAETVHLDAARNIVERSRSNAQSSNLADSIRFIADDAVKFVRRERKRGNFYDGIILDPPTYGHGARGEVWRVKRDLPRLIPDLFALLAEESPFVLLTCHTAGLEGPALAALLRSGAVERFSSTAHFRIESGAISIKTETGRPFFAGDFAFFTCH